MSEVVPLNVAQALRETDLARRQIVEFTEANIESIPATFESIEEAARYAKVVEARARLHADAVHMTRFMLGIIALRVKGSVKHGSDPVGKCAVAFGVNDNILRYYVAAAKRTHGNVRYWARWLAAGGFEKKQKHIIKFTQVMKDPAIMPPEKAAEIVRQAFQDAVETIDNIVDPDERESASIVLTESATRLLEASEEEREMFHVKQPPEAFLDFLRQLYCIGCGEPPPEGGGHDTHHLETGGGAMKGNDWVRIPLCRRCHTHIHGEAYDRFKRETGVDVREALLRVWCLWLSGAELHLPVKLD